MWIWFLDSFLLIIGLALFIPACLAFDSHKYGWTSLYAAGSAVAIGWYYWPQILANVSRNGIVHTIILLITVWLICALIGSFINWVFFCWRVKRKAVDA